MHGANYVASYAATDVEMWLQYDHAVIDRELGYAQKMGLNCVRVFLQSLVYHHDPQAFLARFEDFLATADKHGLKVMPILFDSCFGVAPSLESRHIWVANPGPDRMGSRVVARVGRLRDGGRVCTCGRPTHRVVGCHERADRNAPGGDARRQGADRRLRCPLLPLVKQLDTTHPITVGIATWDNCDVLPLIDVLSCHSYAAGVEAFRRDLTGTQNQARAAGKPWIVSECCNPAAGSTYEMVMPVLRELGVGHTVWQLIIGRDQFNAASGLVYPDGTVRRIAQVEAVMNGPATGFEEKPDEQGLPIRHDIPVLQATYFEACARRRDGNHVARAGHAARIAPRSAGGGS